MARRHQSRKRRRTNKRGGDLGILGTAAVPITLLAMSKFYSSRRNASSSPARGRKRKSRRR